jgi:hypothetical protein
MSADIISRIESYLKSFSNEHDTSISSKLLREAVEELKRDKATIYDNELMAEEHPH